MVDLSVIKYAKAKKIVAIAGSSSAGAAALIIAIALLGQQSSPLTINLTNSGINLALQENIADNSRRTSYLIAPDTPDYAEYAGQALEKVQETEELDSELTGSKITNDGKSTLYYKYTFYVVNTGDDAADYTMTLGISYPNRSASVFDLAEILRVRVYENKDLSKHEYLTYAKAQQVYDEETGTYVAAPSGEYGVVGGMETYPAEMFLSNSVVCRKEVSNLLPNEVVRYTFVMWLEGNDRDSEGQVAPVGTSIALGVDIDAHEAKSSSE